MAEDGYGSLDDAVKAAHIAISNLEDSNKYEYMSIIYQDPKTKFYKFTTPKTEQKRRQAEVKIRIPKGSARGIYHNHPSEGKGDDLQDMFSQGDVDLAARIGVPSYVGAGTRIMQWDPKNPGKMQPKGGAGSTLKEQVGLGTLLMDLAKKAQEPVAPMNLPVASAAPRALGLTVSPESQYYDTLVNEIQKQGRLPIRRIGTTSEQAPDIVPLTRSTINSAFQGKLPFDLKRPPLGRRDF